MARGWESKAIEEQREAASASSSGDPEAAKDPAKARKLANLKLSRAQTAQALSNCTNARYREMLERALADLEAEIAKLGG